MEGAGDASGVILLPPMFGHRPDIVEAMVESTDRPEPLS